MSDDCVSGEANRVVKPLTVGGGNLTSSIASTGPNAISITISIQCSWSRRRRWRRNCGICSACWPGSEDSFASPVTFSVQSVMEGVEH